MTAIRTRIAEFIKTKLAAGIADGSFGTLTFSAPERKYVPKYELDADDSTINLTVIARSFDGKPYSRSKSINNIEIDVAVQKKVKTNNTTEIDPLADVVEKIMGYLERKNPEDGTIPLQFAEWVGVSNPYIYIPEHLAEKLLFTSVITLTYKA